MSHPYDKHYFHGGTKVGGYAGSGYRDFPVHWTTFDHVMKRCNPASVLELGCGRGYLLKRFADFAGLPTLGLEISEHCFATRAINSVVTHDVTTPWTPVNQGERFDLCLSMAFLEHIPEDKLSVVFAEMARTCVRGLHGIDIHDGDGFDQTHCTIRPLEWWKERLPPGHEAVDKEELERGPIVLPPDINKGVKLNIGSFTHMFHGWTNIDIHDLSDWAGANGYRFWHWDVRLGLPYDAGVVDLIFLSHVLEHFDYADGLKLLRECRRVLKPDGLIRIAVPDARRLMLAYLDGAIGQFSQITASDEADPVAMLNELLYSGDHKAIYDESALLKTLERAGFEDRMVSTFRHSAKLHTMRRETIDLYPEMSLFMEARPVLP